MEEEKKDLLKDTTGTEKIEAPAQTKAPAFSSKWTQQLNNSVDSILNRKDFNYDVNGDALYQQYKDRYMQGGQVAMMDTLGQAATLTGGYGNSYAQMAGQQAYQGYLQGLNDKIPELYQLALDKYDREGDNLYKQYSMLGAQEDKDYDRYNQDRAFDQQGWENAFRLYQLGVRTPEVLGVLGLPEEQPVYGGGEDSGSGSSGGGNWNPKPKTGPDSNPNDNTYRTSIVKEASKQAALNGVNAGHQYIMDQVGNTGPVANAAKNRLKDLTTWK